MNLKYRKWTMRCPAPKIRFSAVGIKIRIMATHGARGRGPVPKLVYRAEAYENEDRFADRKWACAHDHETVEHAFHCGQDWLSSQMGAGPELA
jgi:hypothetical protein